MSGSVKFQAPRGGVYDRDKWRDYWTALSPIQQQWLRDKAQWEHMTLTAVAAEWGAPAARRKRVKP